MNIFGGKLYPFERTILDAVGAALPDSLKAQYAAQRSCINKVQRLLEWNEIEFYCMRFFKVRWPEDALFNNKDEFILGSGQLYTESLNAEVSVWSVGGHLFSIESITPMKPFRTIQNAGFVLAKNATQLGTPADVSAGASRRQSRG